MRTMKKQTLFVLLVLLFLLGACKDSGMQEGEEWLNDPNLEDSQSGLSSEIPGTDVYEVTASKVDFAFMELQQESIVKLPSQRAIWFTGHYYTCSPGKEAYLVRAVYGHAGTGAFNLKRIDDDLLIVHQSLGHSTIYQKTALIVNLDFEPAQIFIRVKIAE